MTEAETQKVKFVGDTNFWLTATLWRGLCYRLKQFVVSGTLVHFTSHQLMSEFSKVLRRDFNLSDDQTYLRDNELGRLSGVVSPQFGVLEQITVLRNYADKPVLECAVWGWAQYLVTRDKDLLTIGNYENVKIITPEDFHALISELIDL